MKIKIIGVRKAVGDYKRYNKGGYYSPEYGYLMINRKTGEVWTDYFYSLGHNEWKQYRDRAIINLFGWKMEQAKYFDDEVNMANVRNWATACINEYNREEA